MWLFTAPQTSDSEPVCSWLLWGPLTRCGGGYFSPGGGLGVQLLNTLSPYFFSNSLFVNLSTSSYVPSLGDSTFLLQLRRMLPVPGGPLRRHYCPGCRGQRPPFKWPTKDSNPSLLFSKPTAYFHHNALAEFVCMYPFGACLLSNMHQAQL